MKRKNIANIVIVFLLGVIGILGILIFVSFVSHPKSTYTTNIQDYYSKRLYRYSDVLPRELPPGAQLVNFFYYDYDGKDTDVFLEIKFESEDLMRSFLNLYEKQCKEKTSNPYKESYEDLYFSSKSMPDSKDTYIGYCIDPDEDAPYNYKCNFGVVSYSYDELRVIFTYVTGYFQNDINYHTPTYFMRFQIPVTQKLEYAVYK